MIYRIWIIILLGIWIFYFTQLCIVQTAENCSDSAPRHGTAFLKSSAPEGTSPNACEHTLEPPVSTLLSCSHVSAWVSHSPPTQIWSATTVMVPETSSAPLAGAAGRVTLTSPHFVLSFYPPPLSTPQEEEWWPPLFMPKDSHQGTLSSSSPSPCAWWNTVDLAKSYQESHLDLRRMVVLRLWILCSRRKSK